MRWSGDHAPKLEFRPVTLRHCFSAGLPFLLSYSFDKISVIKNLLGFDYLRDFGDFRLRELGSPAVIPCSQGLDP